MSFADLGLSDELLKSVIAAGYDTPTAIQAQAIPSVLMMRDLIGIAQTGTGKTAGFVLPMIDILAHGRRRALMPRSLILEPTRELAAQVAENFEKYGVNHDLKMALLIGGVQMGDQIKALQEGVDVLIATPGRLMDLFERGKILLTGCSMLVIDEADRMLDMGFIPDIENICTKLPAQRQTLLFSATMPPPIKKLADRFLSNPKYIEVARPASNNTSIVQHKVKVSSRGKREMLRHLLRTDNVTTAIVFANKKTTVRDLAKSLKQHHFSVGEIHGDMDQSSRIAELDRFKDGKISILVASDVAARGLDVKGVSHVFNFDTPWHPDDYVHRIGRTGRGGATGRAFTLYTDDDAEAIANVEKLTGGKIPEMVVSLEAKGDRLPERSGRRAEAETEAPREVERVEAVRGETDGRPRQRRAKGALRDERAPREARAPREEQPIREERVVREEQPVRAERAVRQERAPREERPRREPRAERGEHRRDDRRDRWRDQDTPSKPGEWNGPIPEFLGVSALG
jgi:superfamily II DNA/RNA helicase